MTAFGEVGGTMKKRGNVKTEGGKIIITGALIRKWEG